MSNTIIKKIEIQHPTANIEVDIGAEAQSITVSRNASGEIITDLETEIVDSTETLAETLKEEESPFTGATASANGTKGLVPQPVAGDENKCLFGDATWRESISGSSITITSLEASLSGKQVSISDGTHTKTGTFDSSGICTITGITFVGNLTITSTDGTETATKIVNMPYFGVYATTLSFWAATVNITGSDELKGALVTVKNSNDVTVGTVTLSSTDATGVFVASEADTYKFNFTYNGKNYSEELEVTSQTTYNLSLSVGFDWQVWLDEGRVSKSFSSLDDILEDEETLRQLMLVHDSVDYLASQNVDESVEKVFNTNLAAKWINLSDYALDTFYAVADIKDVMDTADKYGYGEWVITDNTTTPPTWGAKGNVPIMTANNAPYGAASASSVNESSYAAWKAFDNSVDPTSSGGWVASSSASFPQWIQYKFVNPICAKRVKLMFNRFNASATVKVSASNDGSTFTDIVSGVTVAGTEEKIVSMTDNDNYYLIYRLTITAQTRNSGASIGQLVSLQFYGRELKVSVPTMTSNTAPYGEVTATGTYTGYPEYKAFDGKVVGYNNAGRWATSIQNAYIMYKFNKPMIAKMFYLYVIQYSDNRADTCQIYGSNDGLTFTPLKNVNLAQVVSVTANIDVVTIENEIAYQYYKFEFHKTSSYMTVDEIKIFGLDYSEKEFEAGTTKKWLYDHGVKVTKLKEAESSGVVEYQSSQFLVKGTSNNHFVACVAKEGNLGSYNLIRAIVGDTAYRSTSDDHYASMAVYNGTSPSSGSTKVALSHFSDTKLPSSNAIDISQVSDGNYPAIITQETTRNVTISIKEWWLE